MKKLNFGCGEEIIKDYDNYDKIDFDFNVFPYPIEDNTYEYIYSKCVIEHLIDITSVLKELVRVSKNGCRMFFITTYFNNYTAYSSIEHLHFFNKEAWKTLDINGLRIVEVKLISSKLGYIFPFKEFLSKYIPGLIKQIHITFEVIK